MGKKKTNGLRKPFHIYLYKQYCLPPWLSVPSSHYIYLCTCAYVIISQSNILVPMCFCSNTLLTTLTKF
ncbi:hypothetical protein XELAEV_18011065mg [Xenopus laevis]|uniref:Uncharacterized protein n=1 Tax=Xenopus laevis TaxID=8355 RepID=A0A974DWK2_XENLA|nr:hypothetical protein XELAEV_18011065mg [Xenopus laevis]